MSISKTDQLILLAIIRNIEIVKCNNIHELSTLLHVSSSSITKACKKFGYERYKDMQHRIKWESEYNHESIIRLIIELSEALVCQSYTNDSNYQEWQREAYKKIYLTCRKVSSLSESKLREHVISCITRILFYLAVKWPEKDNLACGNKLLSELTEYGLQI